MSEQKLYHMLWVGGWLAQLVENMTCHLTALGNAVVLIFDLDLYR